MGKIYKILIHEDESDSRELLSNLLQKFFYFDHEISYATNYLAAINCLKSSHYDIVFSDNKTPFQNGDNLFNFIKNKKTQVVLNTALGKDNIIVNESKPIYFLQKPIDIDDFKIICQMMINNIEAFDNSLMI